MENTITYPIERDGREIILTVTYEYMPAELESDTACELNLIGVHNTDNWDGTPDEDEREAILDRCWEDVRMRQEAACKH